jgi:hypothetical protein
MAIITIRRVIKTLNKFCVAFEQTKKGFIEKYEIIRKAYNLTLEKICRIADKYNKVVGTHGTGRGIAFNMENLSEMMRLFLTYGELDYCYTSDKQIASLFFGFFEFDKVETVERLLRNSEIIEIIANEKEHPYDLMAFSSEAMDDKTGLPHELNYIALKEGINRVHNKLQQFNHNIRDNLLKQLEDTEQEIKPIIEILKNEGFTHREKRYLCNAYKHLVEKEYEFKLPEIQRLLNEIREFNPDEKCIYVGSAKKWLRNPTTGVILTEGY